MLAPQGHVMLVTSRPAGVTEKLFKEHFHQLQLCALTDKQQEEVINMRVEQGRETLLEYVRTKVPRNTVEDGQADSGERMTGNPLMLSMVISVFLSRRDAGISEMPETIEELYKTAVVFT